MALFDQVSSRISSAAAGRIASAVEQKLAPKLGAKVPGGIGNVVGSLMTGKGLDTLSSIAKGAAVNALGGKIGFGLAGDVLGLLNGVLGGDAPSSASEISGGVTLKNLKEVFDKTSGISYSRKNLWFIRFEDFSGSGAAVDVNLFATEVSYTPVTITGDAVNAGSAVFDTLTGTERIELSVTTLDDANGSLKKWFSSKAGQVASSDGTFGIPIEYLLRATVIHAFIDDGMLNDENGGFFTKCLVRPATMQLGLSRREDGLEEVQFTFVQHDTFTKTA